MDEFDLGYFFKLFNSYVKNALLLRYHHKYFIFKFSFFSEFFNILMY